TRRAVGHMAPLADHLIQRVEQLLADGGRVLGIAGAPGSGKSTLAQTVVTHFGERAQLLPMDGFHLADEELARLGRSARKGAPDTFDVDGYVAALLRVRAREHDVLVPRFDRVIEAAVAGSLRIGVTTDLVVTEGNYLLLQDGPWAKVAALLDESWMLRPDDALRRARLVARHVAHGRSPTAAEAWVATVDEPNAQLIATGSLAADYTVPGD
ncbi:MAG: nucleoside/nucleotide kinase family protein, partial [Ilumatobacteraceae bacterium]